MEWLLLALVIVIGYCAVHSTEEEGAKKNLDKRDSHAAAANYYNSLNRQE